MNDIELIEQAIESAKCRIYRLKQHHGSTLAHQQKATHQQELMDITIKALEHYKNSLTNQKNNSYKGLSRYLNEFENNQKIIQFTPQYEQLLKKVSEDTESDLFICLPSMLKNTRAVSLNKGDSFSLDYIAMQNMKIDTLSLGETFPMTDALHGKIISINKTKKKWWQFWKKRTVTGCLVEVVDK